MSNYLNTTICFDLYGEDPEALQQQGLNQRSPAEGKGKGRIG